LKSKDYIPTLITGPPLKGKSTIGFLIKSGSSHKTKWVVPDKMPIPGTSSLKHFEENLKSTEIQLSKEDMNFLE
jgi:hypothetical protein